MFNFLTIQMNYCQLLNLSLKISQRIFIFKSLFFNLLFVFLYDIGKSVCNKGIENVIYYGLRELTEIIELFTPINKLVNISRLRNTISNNICNQLTRPALPVEFLKHWGTHGFPQKISANLLQLLLTYNYRTKSFIIQIIQVTTILPIKKQNLKFLEPKIMKLQIGFSHQTT